MRTDLGETVKELLRTIPPEKKEDAFNHFFRIYNSYHSCKNLIGTPEYFTRMDEKLTHAYEEAINETRN